MKETKGWEDIIKRFDDGLRADENMNITDKYGDGWEFNGEYHCDDLIEYCHNFIASELKRQREEMVEKIKKTTKHYGKVACSQDNPMVNMNDLLAKLEEK